MDERTEHLDDQPVFWREAPTADGGTPVLWVHGVPTNSDDWLGFLATTGGIAPDLPGFGRSGKRADLAFDMAFFDNWIERFVAWRGLERVRLVVHDWGSVALQWAQRFPERVEKLVIIDAVPLLPGYRWHRMARGWRTPVLGEVLIGTSTRFATNLVLREANATPGPMPKAFVDSIVEHNDNGTQRAILRLYRSADPEKLAAAGARLGELTCPALVVWGDKDPYIDPSFADAYAAALGGRTEVLHLPDAGHWPWIDRPDLVATVDRFLRS